MSDVSQVHHPERLEPARMEVVEESPYIKKLEEEFVHIKEEQEEYFIRVENPHIEEQQEPHPLKKEEEDPPLVKVEVVSIPKWTSEPLTDEDGGPSEASRGTEPPNGSNSRSKEGSQADNLLARTSESDDFTSHSLFGEPAYEMMETDPDWAPSLHLLNRQTLHALQDDVGVSSYGKRHCKHQRWGSSRMQTLKSCRPRRDHLNLVKSTVTNRMTRGHLMLEKTVIS
ncbi:uncharacterized protein LOC130928020 isoform X4 [Corythoichthys intestinalis]|uniref:uncharacterized protein LOC130928020 isoform X4 n=1 Tax=Corythoichthys intestinalis TaxID=161448 RepID=UPI0025A5E6A2|nr:uncharacterized protein LOC130928020 isoform X4 [Corythoichthys intestinalis]